MVILLQTSEKLKIHAEKARHGLIVVANEISEDLYAAAENSPEPVKDIVETFVSSTEDWTKISEIRDFHVGIPLGLAHFVSSFLFFMLFGDTSEIRFMILGGTLVALSVSSQRSWKRGEKFCLSLKGQAAIATILSFNGIGLLPEYPAFLFLCSALLRGAVVAFYLYRIMLDGGETNASNLKHGA